MMKQHSNSAYGLSVRHTMPLRIVTGLVGVALIVPSFVLAQTGTTDVVSAPVRANFCTSVRDIGAKVVARIVERQTRYDAKRIEVAANIKTRLEGRTAKGTSARKAEDAKRAEAAAGLTALAKTDQQKAAVAKYVAAIHEAVAARQSAVTTAVSSFRNAVEAAATARQTGTKAIVDTFLVDANTAIQKAYEDCASEVKPLVARANYAKAMSAARVKMVASVKALDSRRDTLKPVAVARRAEITKAISDFKTATELARKELKGALGTP